MNISLRKTTDHDIPFVVQAESSEDNSRFVVQWPDQMHRESLDNPDIGHLIIEDRENGNLLGYVILAGLDGPHQSIELKRLVVTEKGKGIGRQALKAISRMAFNDLSANRLWLDVVEHNSRARHVYESEGFVTEGILRECLKSGENFESLVVMSVLRSEYENRQV